VKLRQDSIYSIVFICLSVLFVSCGSSTGGTDPNGMDTMTDLPILSIRDARGLEIEDTLTMFFEMRLSALSESDITLDYTLNGITAEPDVDFARDSGSFTILAGEMSANLPTFILADDQREVDEEFSITISNPQGAVIMDDTAIATIMDNDDQSLAQAEDGYITNEDYFGYDVLWSDEFEGDVLNDADYNYDIGDGCPNLCGWGNNELEMYTDLPQNIKLDDGSLVITATKNGTQIESAKIHTKHKIEFLFGRIDVRARLPEGQGIWPAIWMLGANIDEVGWPACGEIDIMEMVGHEANKTHGTAHWGFQGEGSTFKGFPYTIDEKFSEEYHVFSLIWEQNKIEWFVDENKFYTLSSSDLANGQVWRFNQEFYLIFNVAVGGNWPGSPDETTVFPQSMEIDYVRVFQRN